MLGDELKILWLEHVVLDKTEGAFISAEHMAQRLGKSKDSIERGRRELLRVGLLQKGQRARGQTGTWYPVLPAACIPSARPTPADISGLANRLDDHIRAIRSGVVVPTQRGEPHYFTAQELEAVERQGRPTRLKVAASVQFAAVPETARMRPECRTDAASLADSRPEICAQSGGTDDATPIPRVERRLRNTQPSEVEVLTSSGETREEKQRASHDVATLDPVTRAAQERWERRLAESRARAQAVA